MANPTIEHAVFSDNFSRQGLPLTSLIQGRDGIELVESILSIGYDSSLGSVQLMELAGTREEQSVIITDARNEVIRQFSSLDERKALLTVGHSQYGEIKIYPSQVIAVLSKRKELETLNASKKLAPCVILSGNRRTMASIYAQAVIDFIDGRKNISKPDDKIHDIIFPNITPTVFVQKYMPLSDQIMANMRENLSRAVGTVELTSVQILQAMAKLFALAVKECQPTTQRAICPPGYNRMAMSKLYNTVYADYYNPQLGLLAAVIKEPKLFTRWKYNEIKEWADQYQKTGDLEVAREKFFGKVIKKTAMASRKVIESQLARLHGMDINAYGVIQAMLEGDAALVQHITEQLYPMPLAEPPEMVQI